MQKILVKKYILYFIAAPDTQILPVLTENRQQTTELRISMGKVSDKVERILEKVFTYIFIETILVTLIKDTNQIILFALTMEIKKSYTIILLYILVLTVNSLLLVL